MTTNETVPAHWINHIAQQQAEAADYYDNLHDSIPSDIPSTVWESDGLSKGAGE